MAESIKKIDAELESENEVWEKLCKVYSWKRYRYSSKDFATRDEKRIAIFRVYSSKPKSTKMMDVYQEYDLSEEYVRESGDKEIYHCACSKDNLHRWHFATNRVNGNVLRIGHECAAIVAGEKEDDGDLSDFVVSDNEEEEEDSAASPYEVSSESGEENDEDDSSEKEPEKSVVPVTRVQKRKTTYSPQKTKKIAKTSSASFSHRCILDEMHGTLKRNVERAKEMLELYERNMPSK